MAGFLQSLHLYNGPRDNLDCGGDVLRVLKELDNSIRSNADDLALDSALHREGLSAYRNPFVSLQEVNRPSLAVGPSPERVAIRHNTQMAHSESR